MSFTSYSAIMNLPVFLSRGDEVPDIGHKLRFQNLYTMYSNWFVSNIEMERIVSKSLSEITFPWFSLFFIFVALTRSANNFFYF